MPEEVNIDDLIDLPNDDERVQKLQVAWRGTFLNALIDRVVGFVVNDRTLQINLGSCGWSLTKFLFLFFKQELLQKCSNSTEVCFISPQLFNCGDRFITYANVYLSSTEAAASVFSSHSPSAHFNNGFFVPSGLIPSSSVLKQWVFLGSHVGFAVPWS